MAGHRNQAPETSFQRMALEHWGSVGGTVRCAQQGHPTPSVICLVCSGESSKSTPIELVSAPESGFALIMKSLPLIAKRKAAHAPQAVNTACKAGAGRF